MNADTGAARMQLSNVAVRDFQDVLTAVMGGMPAPVPAHVSFVVRWAGHGKARRIRDRRFRFSGRYVPGPATIAFTASNDGSGVTYTSDPAGQRNPGPGEGGAGSPAVGRQRNGVFFH